LGVGDGALDEGEVCGAVGEAGFALIADQCGTVAEQDEIEIVVVIVIEPDGSVEAVLGEIGFEGFETASDIAVEERAGFGEDAEVHETVVIEIAGCDLDYVLEGGQAGIGSEVGAFAIEGGSFGGPDEEIDLTFAGGVDGDEGGGFGIDCSGEDVVFVDRIRLRRCGRGGTRRIVDLGIIAPVDIFGDGGAFLLLLELLKGLKFASGVGGAAERAIEVEELEVGSGEEGVESDGFFKLRGGFGVVALLLEEGSELIVRDGFFGREFEHAFELRDGEFSFAAFAVPDAEVEPGVGEFGVALLDGFEEGDGLIGFAGVEEREGVVELFAGRVGGEVEGLLEFGDRFVGGGGVFEEGFAEVAALFETLFRGRCGSGQQKGEEKGRSAENTLPGVHIQYDTVDHSEWTLD